jgi:hypothetical protein
MFNVWSFRGYWAVLPYVLEPSPAVRFVRGGRVAAVVAVLVGLISLMQGTSVEGWTVWLIAAGCAIEAVALGYLMRSATGASSGHAEPVLVTAAMLAFAVAVVPLLKAANAAAGSALFAVWFGCLLLTIDQAVYHWWVWRRGRGALGRTAMVEAYQGVLASGWKADPQTGHELKAVTEEPAGDTGVSMTVLERVPGTAEFYVAYQCGRHGTGSYGFAVRRYHLVGGEPAVVQLSRIERPDQRVPPMTVGEVLDLIDKIRRCGAASGTPATSNASASSRS